MLSVDPESRMDWRQHIEFNPSVLAGKPVIRGSRIAVELILELLAANCPVDDLLEEYPGITRDDVLAAVAYAAELIRAA